MRGGSRGHSAPFPQPQAGDTVPAPPPVRRRSSANYRAYATEPHAKVRSGASEGAGPVGGLAGSGLRFLGHRRPGEAGRSQGPHGTSVVGGAQEEEGFHGTGLAEGRRLIGASLPMGGVPPSLDQRSLRDGGRSLSTGPRLVDGDEGRGFPRAGVGERPDLRGRGSDAPPAVLLRIFLPHPSLLSYPGRKSLRSPPQGNCS